MAAATITASTSAVNSQVLIVGTDTGLVVSLAAQKKATSSLKSDIQPSYIATHHARRVTCVAATFDSFATASDDCSIVVSQIGCLFGGNEGGLLAPSRLRYRILGAHALPITGLMYLPSDSNLLVSTSKDGTVVVHRLRFVSNSVSGSAIPSITLAQSVEKIVRMPFPIGAAAVVTPGDGTLIAVAGIAEDTRELCVALIDLGVAQRDGNGSGRPLQPFTLLSISEAFRVLGESVTLADVKLAFAGEGIDTSVCVTLASEKGMKWSVSSVQKAMSIGRLEEDISGEIMSEEELKAAHGDASGSFVGTPEQVQKSLAAITDPSAKPNAYFASLYSNFCWSTRVCPPSCVEPAAPAKKQAVVKGAVDSDSEEEVEMVSTPGFGKRARKTKARLTKAEAEAAEWARLAQAVDSLPEKSIAEVDIKKGSLPLRYTELLTLRSLTASDSLFSYKPAGNAVTTSTAIPQADEEEAAAVIRLKEQKSRCSAAQARIDALYAAVAAAAAGKKSAREESASPKSVRASKKHVAEGASAKTVFSLT